METASMNVAADRFWAAVREAMIEWCEEEKRSCIEKVKQRYPLGIREKDSGLYDWFRERLVEAFDLTLERLGDKRVLALAQPISMMEEFVNLLQSAVIEVLEKSDYTELLRDDPTLGSVFTKERMLQDTRDATERFRELITSKGSNPHRAAHEAMERKEWGKAEAIVRGSLAVDPTDIEMINCLFGVGCYSGNSQCVVDALNAGGHLFKQGRAQPGTWDTTPVCAFLQAVVVDRLVVAMNGERRSPGGIILPGPPQPPAMEELQKISDGVLRSAAECVHCELGLMAEWTVDGFLQMCRRVVFEVCRLKTALGVCLCVPWFKGEENPMPPLFVLR